MIYQQTISLIFPCYNEELGLLKLLPQIPDFIDEVIIVDNGSTDQTVHLALDRRTRIVAEKQKGYGSALIKGLKEANGQLLAVMDADCSYPVGKLQEMCDYLQKEGLDFLSGCRFPLTDLKAMPLVNMASNYFISWLTRSLFKIPLKDSQSGMMVFKRQLFREVAPANLNMGFSQEIKIKAWINASLKCGEYRIPYSCRQGKVKFNKIKDGSRNLRDLLVLRKIILKQAKQ